MAKEDGKIAEENKDHECPFCHSLITKEQYDKVIEENELLKEKAKELEGIIDTLKEEKAKLEEKTKNAVDEEKKKALKLQEDIKKLKEEKAKFGEEKEEAIRKERQKLGEQLEGNKRKMQEMKDKIELLEKGMTAQEMGFDFENKMQEWLEIKFDKDKVEKTGKKGDSILRVMNKDKEIGIILVECKKEELHKKASIDEVKRHKIDAKADVGVLVTNGSFGKESKMDGFCNIDGVSVIRPHSAIEFIELLREHIIEVDNLKISEEEKNEEMTRLWRFIHSPEFESQMNAILRDVNQLKELDTKEMEMLEKRGKIEDDILKAHKLILDGIIRTRKS